MLVLYTCLTKTCNISLIHFSITTMSDRVPWDEIRPTIAHVLKIYSLYFALNYMCPLFIFAANCPKSIPKHNLIFRLLLLQIGYFNLPYVETWCSQQGRENRLARRISLYHSQRRLAVAFGKILPCKWVSKVKCLLVWCLEEKANPLR